MKWWRSLLFVPADNETMIGRAASRGADAIILDLEDAVSPDNKAAARENIGRHIADLKAQGSPVCVRVNSSIDLAAADIEASLVEGLDAIVVPKVEGADFLRELAARTSELGTSRNIGADEIGTIATIETASALEHLYKIVSCPNVIGLALGTEDFGLSLGVEPSTECLELPSKLISLAAASRGVMSLSVPISISGFRQVDAYREAAELGRKYGVSGAICIHPDQVAVANEVFTPTESEVARARRVVNAWQEALDKGKAVATLDGQMIDRPVVLRAQRLISISDAG